MKVQSKCLRNLDNKQTVNGGKSKDWGKYCLEQRWKQMDAKKTFVCKIVVVKIKTKEKKRRERKAQILLDTTCTSVLCLLPLPGPVLAQPSSSTADTCLARQKWSRWTSSSTARGWTTWRWGTRPPSGHSSNQQQCQSGQPKHLTGGRNQERKWPRCEGSKWKIAQVRVWGS